MTNGAPTEVATTPAVVRTAFTIDPYILGTDWKRWVQRLEGAFRLFKVPTGEYVGHLLHYVGAASFNTLCDKLTPVDPYTKTYNELKKELDEFYAPAPLEIAENYRFSQRKQEMGESLQDFAAALQRLSINCNFGDYLKTALRNQFVFGLQSKRIQSRLLESEKITFDSAVKTAVSMELSERDAQQLNSNGASVSYVGPRPRNTEERKGKSCYKGSKYENKSRHDRANYSNSNNVKSFSKANVNKSVSKPICYRCGGPHLATACGLDRRIKCHACNQKGHLEKVCFRANTSALRTNAVEEILRVEHVDFRRPYLITLRVNDKDIRFEVDSGAAVSLISKNLFDASFPNAIIQSTNIKLRDYNEIPVKVYGFSMVRVLHNNSMFKLNLYITEVNKQALLGREWINQLGLFNLKTNYIHTSDHTKAVESLLNKYKELAEPGLAKIKNIQAKLKLKPDVTPVFLKARAVPFKLIPLVEEEIQNLVSEGVLVKVNTSEWATPIVPILKSNNKVRICGDFKVTVNPNLIIDDHPLPTVDELFATMSGGKKFSKIDLRQAYLQMEVNPDDRHLLTINTHKGLYECTRLLYGIASAPAIWQRAIENILQGIPGVSVFLDDIRITGPTNEIHLQRLEEVLQRLQEHQLKINVEKSCFFQDEIRYCGHIIDANGVRKDPEKITAITKMPRPRTKSELRAFIGMINYYGKFIRNLSTILYPLNRLLCKDSNFTWGDDCERSFQLAKKEFQSDTILAHYDPNLPLIVATDSSAYGIGAVLSQLHPDGRERVIQFASQTLSETQRKYSQIDREAYSIIYAVKKFHQYLYLNKFTLVTDHQPLVQIFSPKKSLPLYSAMRMQHYALFLQAFNYDIRYKNTKLHSNADCLSRLPESTISPSYDVVDVFQIQSIDTMPVTREIMIEQTLKDRELNKIIQKLRLGKDIKAKERFNVNIEELQIQDDILLKGNRVVIPKLLRKQVLDELHDGHFGVVKTKALARGYCWWPGIDRDIEKLVANCTPCQQTRNNPPKVETHLWEPVKAPFERVHVDFAGPFMGKQFFILVDAYTKFPVVKILNNTTAENTIQTLREIFSTFGLPRVVVTDNGTQFTSNIFINYLKSNGIKFKRTAPYNPATNGQAERFVQILKNALLRLESTTIELDIKLQKLLFQYRIIPHCETQKSPAELMFGRRLRTRLELFQPESNNESESQINDNKRIRVFEIGDAVQARNYLGKVKWKNGIIQKRIGKLHYLIKLHNGLIWRRHVNQIVKTEHGSSKFENEQIPFYPLPQVQPEIGQHREVNGTRGAGPNSPPRENNKLSPQNRLSPQSVAVQLPGETEVNDLQRPVGDSQAGASVPSTSKEEPEIVNVTKSSRSQRSKRKPLYLRDFDLNFD